MAAQAQARRVLDQRRVRSYAPGHADPEDAEAGLVVADVEREQRRAPPQRRDGPGPVTAAFVGTEADKSPRNSEDASRDSRGSASTFHQSASSISKRRSSISIKPKVSTSKSRHFGRRREFRVKQLNRTSKQFDVYREIFKLSLLTASSALVALFLALTFAFALLFYMLERNCITNYSGRFLEAFYFSVQSFTTIGYGVYAPACHASNVLVTAEAIIGLFFEAVATGFFFSKLTNPGPALAFGDHVCVHVVDGGEGGRGAGPRVELTIRIVNLRAGQDGEVVQAQLMASAGLDEELPNGSKVLRYVPLKLVRSEHPVFSLAWDVVHEIDAKSVLLNVNDGVAPKTVAEAFERIADNLVCIVISFTGTDDVNGSSVHARKIYSLDDFKFNHSFVDMCAFLTAGDDAGDVTIDFARMSATLEGSSAPSAAGTTFSVR